MPIRVYECHRCGHQWPARKSTPRGGPKVCPSCKSPYWNRLRRSEIQEGQRITNRRPRITKPRRSIR